MYNKIYYLVYIKPNNINFTFKYKKKILNVRFMRYILPYLGILYFNLQFRNTRKLILVKNVQLQFLSIWCLSLCGGVGLRGKNFYDFFNTTACYYV